MDRAELITELIKYNEGDPKRSQHLIKVHSLAAVIGRGEGLKSEEMEILETAAITHDIGIRLSEKKYGNCCGSNQEKEGPGEAEKLLKRLGYPQKVTDRVCWLIGHHHTYDNIVEQDHRILVEADFLVNLYEDGAGRKEIESAYDRIFRTETGRTLCRAMFGLDENERPDSDKADYSQAKVRQGYVVTEKCVQCRSCVDVCPMQCIDGSRKPVYINQEKCLHCGTCAGVCDHKAIIAVNKC